MTIPIIYQLIIAGKYKYYPSIELDLLQQLQIIIFTHTHTLKHTHL